MKVTILNVNVIVTVNTENINMDYIILTIAHLGIVLSIIRVEQVFKYKQLQSRLSLYADMASILTWGLLIGQTLVKINQ